MELIGEDRQRLALLAQRDSLTNLYNRRHFMVLAESSLQRARSSGAVVSLATIDVDRFKNINDTYGHDVGDQVLQSLAQLLSNQLRDRDYVARFGGEEFVVLLHNTKLDVAQRTIERLRKSCEDYAWDKIAANLKVSCSFGVA